jgi:hypothetical protein
MNKNTLVAAPAAGAKELENQKTAKAKRIGGYSSAFGAFEL